MTTPFKAGDKVKLTGTGWTKEFHGVTAGDIVDIYRVGDSGMGVFVGKNAQGSYDFYVLASDTRWGGEVVNHTWVESTNWSLIQEGDIIRVTKEDNTFLVEATYYSYSYSDGDNVEGRIKGTDIFVDLYAHEGWKIEVPMVEPKKLEPGFYASKQDAHGLMVYAVGPGESVRYSSADGAWVPMPNPRREFLDNLVRIDITAITKGA